MVKRNAMQVQINTEGGMAAMFFFTVLSLVNISSAWVNQTSYVRLDPSTGQELECNRCAPGYHLHAHCTWTRQTECRQCSAGFYTEFWNYIPECLPCDSCFEHQVTRQQCAPSHNRVCECEEGYFLNSHFCKKHTQCGARYGVKSKGTPYADTECELCTDGHYAEGPRGNTSCVPHKACQHEERLLINGSSWHDSVCATCNHIVERGWDGLIKPLVFKLFAQQKQRKVQRFINRFILEEGARPRRSNGRSTSASVLEPVRKWLEQATAEQLTKLPGKLTAVNVFSMAGDIENMIRKFQEESKQCSNSILDEP